MTSQQLRISIAATIGLFMAGCVAILISIGPNVANQITDDPIAEWEPVVNPQNVHGGSGFIPGLWRVTLEDGTTCYLAYGYLDDLECVGPNR